MCWTARIDAALPAEMELMAETSGAKVHRTDAMIAAIAVNRGTELYTFDIRHLAVQGR